MKAQALNNAIFGFIYHGTCIITSLILTPYLFNTLGESDYGVWVLALSIIGWFGVLTLGLPAAVQRELAIYISRHETDNVNMVFSTALCLFVGIGFVGMLGMLLLGLNADLFNVENEAGFSVILMVFALKLFWDIAMIAFYGFYTGLLRMDIDEKLTTIAEIVKTAIIFALVGRFHLFGALIAIMVTDFILHGAQIFYAKRLYPQMRFRLADVNSKTLASLFNFSKHIIATSIVRIVYTKSDPFVVTQIFGTGTLAVYSISQRLSSHVASLSTSITNVFAPLFTIKHATNADMTGLFKKVSALSYFTACCFFIPLLALSDSFIHLWIGDDFQQDGMIMNALVFALLCQTFSKPIQNVLLAKGNHQSFTGINIVGVVTTLTFSIAAAHAIGLPGIPVGAAGGYFLGDVLLHGWALKRYTEISLRPLWLRFGFAAAVLYASSFVLHLTVTRIAPESWLTFVGVATAVTAIGGFTSYFLLLDAALRREVNALVIGKLKR